MAGIIIRFFGTPAIISKMGPTHSDKCWRSCRSHIGNLTHILWTCPKLKAFWKEVFEALGKIFKKTFNKDPKMVMLGLIPNDIIGRGKKYLLQILLIAALKCITVKWLKAEPPTYNMWIGKVWEIYHMEQITYSLRL